MNMIRFINRSLAAVVISVDGYLYRINAGQEIDLDRSFTPIALKAGLEEV